MAHRGTGRQHHPTRLSTTTLTTRVPAGRTGRRRGPYPLATGRTGVRSMSWLGTPASSLGYVNRERGSVMEINKSKVVELLKHRGLNDRAAWVDRQLPERIDVNDNAALLATLNINPDELADDAPSIIG
jgi:hypothetical protein